MILVASSSPLDQYIVNHPDYFFGKSPERALIDPNNLYILLNHIKCAAYELPFEDGELFDGVHDTAELLDYLCDQAILRHVAGRYYWMAEEFPQAGINLRSASDQNFLIVDITDPKKHRVIGEMDRFTVPMLLHQYAIYMHEGDQYQVEQLDFDDKKAYVRRVNVGYYTDADLTTSLKVLDEFDRVPTGSLTRSRGEVLVSSIVTLFKKIRFDTHENLGWGPVTLPELEMQTTAAWWTLPEWLETDYEREPVKNAMVGLAHILRHIAPMYLMCSAQDVHVVYHVRDPFTGRPTIYLYDSIPAASACPSACSRWTGNSSARRAKSSPPAPAKTAAPAASARPRAKARKPRCSACWTGCWGSKGTNDNKGGRGSCGRHHIPGRTGDRRMRAGRLDCL